MVLALILLLFLVNTKYGNEKKGNLNKDGTKNTYCHSDCVYGTMAIFKSV